MRGHDEKEGRASLLTAIEGGKLHKKVGRKSRENYTNAKRGGDNSPTRMGEKIGYGKTKRWGRGSPSL